LFFLSSLSIVVVGCPNNQITQIQKWRKNDTSGDDIILEVGKQLDTLAGGFQRK
jgi:hypothetical protein